ncbi:MAG: hypothetical protein ACOC44_12330 [Promethearchaeia archaeon]
MQIQKYQKHHPVMRDGFKVCQKCGLVLEEFEYDYIGEAFKRYEKNKEIRQPTAELSPEQKAKFKRLKAWDKNVRREHKNMHPYVYNRLNRVISQLPLSHEVKQNIKQYIFSQQIEMLFDGYQLIYEYIAKYDLPITSKKLKKILNSDREREIFDFYKKETRFIRHYYWKLERMIKKIPIRKAERMRLYKLSYNYYKLIRFGLHYMGNPILLMKNLLWGICNKVYPYNQIHKKFRSKKFFGIKKGMRKSTIPLNSFWEKIRKKDLDKGFSERILVSKLFSIYSLKKKREGEGL